MSSRSLVGQLIPVRNMASVFYRNPQHDYPLAVRGEGVYLFDSKGRKYLDGSGGAAIACLGHGHPAIIKAVSNQLETMAFAHTVFFTNEPQEELSAILSDQFGESGARVYFSSGGSEANETAIKLARQYWVARGRSAKTLMISRDQSYHGNTLGALSVSGHPGRKETYGPLVFDWPKIPPCYAYRHQKPDESEIEYGLRAARELESKILEVGPENVSAFIAETIAGATLGAVLPAKGYFKEIRKICSRYEVLLILDEVMAGRGRTGHWFAFEQEGITPDIVTVAKGLGGGYQPIGAVICRQFIHDQIVQECGAFDHGHTYVGHATACAAGVAVAQTIEKQGLLLNVRKMGGRLKGTLEDTFRDHPKVGDIRGRGLLLGLELVEDRSSRAPICGGPDLASKIKSTAMENGLICYPGSGTADGVVGAHILLAPPFIYEDRHVDELIEKLRTTLKEVL